MNDRIDDELLSAYLDGELSGDELLRAERLLEQNAESRQMLDELRAIGDRVRRLPRHTLEGDFTQRVLRQAEREMLAPAVATRVGESQEIRPAHAAMPLTPRERIPANRWRRPLAWSGLAVAAALLLMFLGPRGAQDRLGHREIALAPAGADQAGKGASLRAEVRDLAEGAPHDHFDVAVDSKGGQTNAPGGATAGLAAKPAGAAALDETRERLAKTPSTPDADGDAALRLSDFSDAERHNLGYVATAQNGRGPAGEPIDADTLVVWCDVRSVPESRRSLRELLAKQQITWDTEATTSAGAYSVSDGALPSGESGPPAAVPAPPPADKSSSTQESLGDRTPAPAAPAASGLADAPAAAGQLPATAGPQALQSHDQLGQVRRHSAARGAAGRRQENVEGQPSPLLGAVLVDATPQQIDALVENVKARTEVFFNVVEEPAAETRADQAGADQAGADQAGGDQSAPAASFGIGRRESQDDNLAVKARSKLAEEKSPPQSPGLETTGDQAKSSPRGATDVAPAERKLDAPTPTAPKPSPPSALDRTDDKVEESVKESATKRLGGRGGLGGGGFGGGAAGRMSRPAPSRFSQGASQPPPAPAQVAPAPASEQSAPPPAADPAPSAAGTEGKSAPIAEFSKSRSGQPEAPAAKGQSQSTPESASTFGRAQEILVPEAALRGRQRNWHFGWVPPAAVSDEKAAARPPSDQSLVDESRKVSAGKDNAWGAVEKKLKTNETEKRAAESEATNRKAATMSELDRAAGAEGKRGSDSRDERMRRIDRPHASSGPPTAGAKPGGGRQSAADAGNQAVHPKGLMEQSQQKLAEAPLRRRAIFVFRVLPEPAAAASEAAAEPAAAQPTPAAPAKP